MKRIEKILSKILVVTLILTSIGYTNPVLAEEDGITKEVENIQSEDSLMEIEELSMDKNIREEVDNEDQAEHRFNPGDWEIIKSEDNKWTLKQYKGGNQKTVYIPGLYKTNDDENEIRLDNIGVLNLPVEEIIIEEIDGKKVYVGDSSFGNVFSNNNYLKKIDLRGLNSPNLIDMTGMFLKCLNLEKVDLSGLDTKRVIDMNSLFMGCDSLVDVNLSDLNTGNLKNMSSMFYGCNSLANIDLEDFDTSNVTNMSSLFSYCYELENIDIKKLNTSNVTSMSSMFLGCKKLASIDFGNLDTSRVTTMRNMFFGCEKLTEIDLSNLVTSELKDMGYVFENCKSLNEVDLNGLDLKNVETMEGLFTGCDNLLAMDLSNLDIPNIKNMNFMFSECESLANVELCSLNLPNLTQVIGMFKSCESLETIDISKLNMPNLLEMTDMFLGCKNLNSVELGNLDISKLIKMNSVFESCINLRNIDLSGLNTQGVEDMSKMFKDCTRLEKLNISNLDTSNVKKMNMMFENCKSLKSIDVSSFNVSNVEDINRMFKNCTSLEKLDLSNFYLSIYKLDNIWENCINLKDLDISGVKIDIPDNIDVDFSESPLFDSNPSLEKLKLPEINIGKNVKGLLIFTDIDYVDLNAKVVEGRRLGENSFRQMTLEEYNFIIKSLIEMTYEAQFYKGDYKDILIEDKILNDEDIADINSIEDYISIINRNLNGLKSYGDRIRFLESFEKIFINEYINSDGDEELLENLILINKVKKAAAFAESGYPLLITTNNPDFFMEYKFETDNRVPMELGPIIDAGSHIFKDGSKQNRLYHNSQFVYTKEDLKGLGITNTMIDDLRSQLKLSGISGDRLKIVGILDGDKIIGLEELVGRNLFEERNKVYKLIFEGEVHDITFVDDGKENLVRVKSGERLREEDIPETSKEGYEFIGWNTKMDGSGENFDPNEQIREDKTFYAIYKRKTVGPVNPFNEYSVIFVDDGKENLVRVKSGERLREEDIPKTSKEGYEFIGWNTKVDGSGENFDPKKTIIRDIRVYAIYSPVERDFEHMAYLKGYEDKTIRANGNLTREEAAMVFYRLLDEGYKDKETKPSHHFPDVKEGKWSEKAIITLANMGILEGYEDGTFRPERPITRAELTTIVAKLVEESELKNSSFSDIKGHWAEEYIKKIESRDWVDGYEDRSFRPDISIRRNEFSKIINRYLDRKPHKKNIPENILEFKDFDKSYSSKWYYEDLLEATNNHRGLIIDGGESWKEIF